MDDKILKIVKDTTKMYEKDSLPLEDLEEAIHNRLPGDCACRVYRTELETPNETIEIMNKVLDDILTIDDMEFVCKYITTIEYELFAIIVYKEKQ